MIPVLVLPLSNKAYCAPSFLFIPISGFSENLETLRMMLSSSPICSPLHRALKDTIHFVLKAGLSNIKMLCPQLYNISYAEGLIYETPLCVDELSSDQWENIQWSVSNPTTLCRSDLFEWVLVSGTIISHFLQSATTLLYNSWHSPALGSSQHPAAIYFIVKYWRSSVLIGILLLCMQVTYLRNTNFPDFMNLTVSSLSNTLKKFILI